MSKDKVSLSSQHWEMKYHPTVKKDSKKAVGEQFSPKKGKDRLVTYEKTNECDH